MAKYRFSIPKILDHIGKVGIFLVTGGIAGSLFTSQVPAQVGVAAVITGGVFVIIGSYEKIDEEES